MLQQTLIALIIILMSIPGGESELHPCVLGICAGVSSKSTGLWADTPQIPGCACKLQLCYCLELDVVCT